MGGCVQGWICQGISLVEKENLIISNLMSSTAKVT